MGNRFILCACVGYDRSCCIDRLQAAASIVYQRMVCMTMEKELVFCLQQTVYVDERKVPLSRICDIHGDVDHQKMAQRFLTIKNKVLIVSAFDVLKELEVLYPGYTIQNLGPTESNVFIKSKQQRKWVIIVKVVVLSVVLFFGGAIAMMTFHEDVDMRVVHSGIYRLFTGVEAEKVPIVSVPYSIGVAIGFAALYGLFVRKKQRPTILDLDINKHENILRDYQKEKSKSSDG